MTSANRFIAPTINPTLLPAPDAIETISLEALIEARISDFTTRAAEAGFDYDVGSLETDPIKIDQTTGAYREALMRARVNQGIRAVLPAYAQGADLDNIAARANVERLVLVPATNTTPAVLESDQSLLVRYLTSFATPAAGSVDGYIHHTILAWPYARDIAVLGPGFHNVPGRAAIYLLADGGVAVPSDTVQAVRAYLRQDHIKPLTDDVVVSSAGIVAYAVELTITVPRGPDPVVIAAAAKSMVEKVCDARYAIGAKVYVNSLEGAAYVGNVLRVTRASPAADIVPLANQAAFCTGVTVNWEIEN